jgi:hypothetical protein
MGVRKLNKFLTLRDVIIKHNNIHEFIRTVKTNNNCKSGKIIIAIDFWLYAHKFAHSSKSNNILLGFWNQMIKFLTCGIIPLYVMDGSVPIEKHDKIEERNRKRLGYISKLKDIDEEINKYINISDIMNNDNKTSSDSDTGSIDSNLELMYEKKEKLKKYVRRIKTVELYNIQKLFNIMGIPHIKAEYEADALCAKLYKNNLITSCLSDDMDMLALGCGSTIKFFDGKIIEFNLDYIMNNLNFTQEQFIDMCILFGCDYLQHPIRLECDDIYEMLNKHKSLLNVLESNEHSLFNMNNNNVKVIGEHYYRVKDIYMYSHEREIIPVELVNIKLNKINIDDVVSFIKKLKWLDSITHNTKNIEDDLLKINRYIQANTL